MPKIRNIYIIHTERNINLFLDYLEKNVQEKKALVASKEGNQVAERDFLLFYSFLCFLHFLACDIMFPSKLIKPNAYNLQMLIFKKIHKYKNT